MLRQFLLSEGSPRWPMRELILMGRNQPAEVKRRYLPGLADQLASFWWVAGLDLQDIFGRQDRSYIHRALHRGR